jgi:hypothetical protein
MMARESGSNLGRLSPMILTASFAILIGALLVGLTDISTGTVLVIVVVLLLMGLVGVWMLDRRRPVA